MKIFIHFSNLLPGFYNTTYAPETENDVGQINDVQRKVKNHHGSSGVQVNMAK